MRSHNLIPIRFEDSEPHQLRGTESGPMRTYPRYHGNAPLVIWTSKSKTLDSFHRAVRKAKARGLRLLSYHFSGAKFVANFGA
jgi:hypothetical protein